uniref:BESS domain-containing protein n=1 Tax=Stomoxys calcitrans TaxID=35570 RepID=A0A1I8PTI1_STOCA
MEVVVPDFDVQNSKSNHAMDDGASVLELPNEVAEVDTLKKSDPLNTHGSLSVNPKNNPTEYVVLSLSNQCNESMDNHKSSDGVKDEIAIIDSSMQDSLENDPMDLLELNDQNSISTNDEEVDDDRCSTGSSSVQTSCSSSNVLEWCKDYSWLLYEESDEMYGHCLHCDVKINVRSLSFVKQHEISMYHKERSDYYLAFREEEERNNLGTPLFEIKQEFGTNSYIAALKLKRKSQAEALNNYNWRRWLEECPWLERDNPVGTVGRCKYCKIRLNVEFSYLRKRHQDTGKHKECAKMQNSNHSNNSTDEENDEEEKNGIRKDRYRWSEVVEDQQGTLRCKICETKTGKNNYPRHLRTASHIQNEAKYLKSLKVDKFNKCNPVTTAVEDHDNVSPKSPISWDVYAKQHPWLVADSSDPRFAYCKYCEKRVLFGNSAAKRATHENSIQHKNQAKQFKERGADGQNINSCGSEDEETNGDAGESEQSNEETEEEDDGEKGRNSSQGEEDAEETQEEQNEGEDSSDSDGEVATQTRKSVGEKNDSRKRISRHDVEWYDQYPWCTKYKADPVNYCFCKYCKIAIIKTYSRSKHNKTARHRAAEAEFLRRQKKKKTLFKSKKLEEFSEWAVDIKAQPNLYYCKYCRVRISTRYSKKQHAASKIHQINQNLYNPTRKKNSKLVKREVIVEEASSSHQRNESSPKPAIKVPSFLTLVKQWQKRFSWLTYKRKEVRSNYAFCKVCEQSLYIRSIKNVYKHQRSGKHFRTVNQLRRQKLQEERTRNEAMSTQESGKCPKREAESTTSARRNILKKPNTQELDKPENEPQQNSSYKNTLEEMQKLFSWIEQSKKPLHVHCRYCDNDVYYKTLFLRNHSNSKTHRQAVVKQHQVAKAKREKRRHSEQNTDNEVDDIELVDNDIEEILISEQDDNWTVKSENMDEHEVLDYLLQRSGKTNENNNSCRNAAERSKRAKRTRSQRRVNETNASSLFASILSTPLTLASCLGPLIQQQVQQQITNTSQAPSSGSAASSQAAHTNSEQENSFDLFFKSVSESMKKLPIDIAAEGKVKVMQILCDLELKAMKRQHQANIEVVETTLEQNQNRVVNSAEMSDSINSSIPEEPADTSTATEVTNNKLTPKVQHDNFVSEQVITPLYNNVVTSPAKVQQPRVVSLAPTGSSFTVSTAGDANKEKSINVCQSPIIGVIDKSTLHTLQFKNANLVKQGPKTHIVANNNATLSNSSIRCIPFKNLTKAVSNEANAKITRIHMPLVSTPNSTSHTSTSISTIAASTPSTSASTAKGMLNLRNIQITKRTITQPGVVSSATTITTPAPTDKRQQGTCMAPANVQRWTPVNGVAHTGNLKKQTNSPNYTLSAKQNSTSAPRNYQ